MIGTQLGQFHSDFDSEKGKVKSAVKSIFLGKKAYVDKLELEDGTFDYHLRMKGISTNLLKWE